ncbi:uncharacterized protein NFIA_056130 [Aspergillus fischeri NRRL 181]|uniref:Secreted protein n=1 Tax=Neosartorya fischeri (strain ATCC 1020 / DSM 3700 / CBS 544.65 / FGSC A1164 / JCM 1740 / NRRL 181 / WB 181) TaxID=331117 RepID=A1DN93_NEOFI|nr:uncharacterized protein NFIA_056130 [Aspergillus fischeri NRRL 181]EAW16264.1 hypothetical protein NFIA_056130 [Aspergillus fischeri NRRL 181]
MFTLRSILGLSLMIAPTLVASFEDIYFGSYSGEGLGGTWRTPSQMGVCYYQVMVGDQSNCDGLRTNPADGSGGCPGQNFSGPNFCHMPIPGLPEGYELTATAVTAPLMMKQQTESGTLNITDKNNGNVKVGRCVYEYKKGPNCASTGSFLTNRFVHCYPDA